MVIANRLVNAIGNSYTIGGHLIQISASIGITYIEADNSDWEYIYHKADLAMYEAKSRGPGSIVTYDEQISEKYNSIIKLRKLLNQAIDNQELYLNIQPQYNYERELISAEVLLRWNNPELGLVSPADFIPLAEESGTILTIGKWVIEETFKLINDWSTNYPHIKTPSLAINISVKQFEQNDFIDFFDEMIAIYPVNPELIRIELTESLLIADKDTVIKKIVALKQRGLYIEIDDFGTGYSSLSYLNQLPIDKIKIDRSFIDGAIGDERKTLVLDALINIGKNLNISVLAEGVETQEQVEFLYGHGCSEYQGYYFNKPMAVADFCQLFLPVK